MLGKKALRATLEDVKNSLYAVESTSFEYLKRHRKTRVAALANGIGFFYIFGSAIKGLYFDLPELGGQYTQTCNSINTNLNLVIPIFGILGLAMISAPYWEPRVTKDIKNFYKKVKGKKEVEI